MGSVQESKTRLMNAALELVAEIGYKSASTKKIAQTAGMNEASIFRLFGSKKQLFLDAVFSKSMSGADIDMRGVWAPKDFRGRLDAFLSQCLELCIRQLSVNRMFILTAQDVMDPRFQKMVLSRVMQVAELFRLFLEREREAGSVRLADGAVLPEMVFSRLSMAAMYFSRLDGDDSRIAEDKRLFVEDLAAFLRDKLCVRDAG